MVDNIEKVLERGEKIELLVDKTDNLRFQARHISLCFSCFGVGFRVEGFLPTLA
jgi:Synaptobrevin